MCHSSRNWRGHLHGRRKPRHRAGIRSNIGRCNQPPRRRHFRGMACNTVHRNRFHLNCSWNRHRNRSGSAFLTDLLQSRLANLSANHSCWNRPNSSMWQLASPLRTKSTTTRPRSQLVSPGQNQSVQNYSNPTKRLLGTFGFGTLFRSDTGVHNHHSFGHQHQSRHIDRGSRQYPAHMVVQDHRPPQ